MAHDDVCALPHHAGDDTSRGQDVVARWGGIVAGLFVTMASLILLAAIGAATGLTAFDLGDRAAPFAIGAGIAGVLVTIAAFFLGGFTASSVARHSLPRRGAAVGALTWAVAVPVMAFGLAVLALGTATAAGTTATAAAVAADPATDPDAARAREDAERTAAAATRPENVEQAAKAAGAVGWGAVAMLLLGLGAAALGGLAGARQRARRYVAVTTVSAGEAVAAQAALGDDGTYRH